MLGTLMLVFTLANRGTAHPGGFKARQHAPTRSDAIYLAATKQLLRLVAESDEKSLFLSVGGGADPTESLMRQLRLLDTRIAKASTGHVVSSAKYAWNIVPKDRRTETENQAEERGAMVSLQILKYIGSNSAEVAAGYRGTSCGRGFTYLMKRNAKDEWTYSKTVGPIVICCGSMGLR